MVDILLRTKKLYLLNRQCYNIRWAVWVKDQIAFWQCKDKPFCLQWSKEAARSWWLQLHDRNQCQESNGILEIEEFRGPWQNTTTYTYWCDGAGILNKPMTTIFNMIYKDNMQISIFDMTIHYVSHQLTKMTLLRRRTFLNCKLVLQ